MEVDNPSRPEPMSDSHIGNVIEIMSSPVGTPMKRKSEESASREGKENGSMGKKPKTDEGIPSQSSKPLVELKGRKWVYKEDAAPWILPKRRLLRFETLLLDAEEEGRQITEIPSEFYDLVVMAGHEHGSATEATLVKAIRKALCGTQQDSLPARLVTPIVAKLFTQCNYGLVPSDFPSSSSAPVKIPASLQIRRWEAIEPTKYFPAEHHEILSARKAEREKVRAECARILAQLDDVEARDLIKGEEAEKEDKLDKAAVKRDEIKTIDRSSIEQSPRVSVSRNSREGTAATNDSRRSASPVKKSKMTPEEEEAARLKREEREAKKTEKAERKAAKELEQQKKDEEKARLEAVKAKQANKFGSFFKPKPKAAVTSEKASAVPSPKRATTPELSEFNQVFKPHAVRPGTRWAAINQWAVGNKTTTGIIKDIESCTADDLLQDHMRRHKRQTGTRRSRLPDGLKSGPLHGTVGEVWAAHQEAADPRKVLSQLRKNHKFPWKFLAFDQQARPPYSGTFTKRSATVGPRTPFAQDPMFDYTYDSGDDWEEEEGGEDVDDFGESKPEGEEEDPEEGEEEEDDEFDDWLDDSEDAVYGSGSVDGDDDPLLHVAPVSRQERLPINPIKKADRPRKVTKVTPWFRGPIWETDIGQNTEFSEYRLQLLNDTPDSFDPFTYVSTDQGLRYKATMSTISMGPKVIPCMMGTSAIAAPVPTISNSSTTEPAAGSSGPTTTHTSATKSSRAAGPKIAFPSTHLDELYTLIHGNTKIQTDLVSQLRQHFETVSTKAAIEAKIKEVAIREGKTKDSKWKVKAEAWVAAGLTPPVDEPTPTLAPSTQAQTPTTTTAPPPISFFTKSADQPSST